MNNEWKNPRFPSFDVEDEPVVKPSKVASSLTALLGLAVLISTNTFFVWLALQLVGVDIEYRKAVGLSALWLIFRLYDGVTLGKALSKQHRL